MCLLLQVTYGDFSFILLHLWTLKKLSKASNDHYVISLIDNNFLREAKTKHP